MHLTLVSRPDVSDLTYVNVPAWLKVYFEAFKNHAIANEPSLPKDMEIVSVEFRFSDSSAATMSQLTIEMECYKVSDKSQVDIWGSMPVAEAHRDFFGINGDSHCLKLYPGDFAKLSISTPFLPVERPHFKMQDTGEDLVITVPKGAMIESMDVTPAHTIQSVDGHKKYLHVIEFVGLAKVTAENENPIPSFDGMEYTVLVD